MDANTYYTEQYHRSLSNYDRADEAHDEAMNEYKLELMGDTKRLHEAVVTFLEDCGDMSDVAAILIRAAMLGDYAPAEAQSIVNEAVEYDAKYNGPNWRSPDELDAEREAERAEMARDAMREAMYE